MTITDTDNVSDLYACLPLPRESKFIRVLDVYGPSTLDGSDSPIRCDLRVIDLDSENHPPFAALSYVWGVEAAEGHFVTCGGFTLRVTPNCQSALRHLRDKLGKFTIWIDAICINQQDECEKMNQISLMGDVYSKAETMYVWLGEGNDATNRAMAYLATAGYLRFFFRHGKPDEEELGKPHHWTAVWFAFIAYFNLQNRLPLSSNNGLNQALPNVSRLGSRDSHGNPYASYQDMDDLLDREWVRRIWTYQEILLASNPTVVCGGFHLPWAQFSLGVTFLEYSGVNYREGTPTIASLKTWAHIASSRDYLLSSDVTCFTDNQPCGRKHMPQTTLKRYREFVLNVSESIICFQRRIVLFNGPGLFSTLIIAVLWIIIRICLGTPAIEYTVPSRVVNAATQASSSATACAIACTSSNITACAEACGAASSAAGNVAFLSQTLDSKRTYQSIDCEYGPPFGVSVLVVFVLFIISLGSAQHKHHRLAHVSLAQSDTIDLVDGLCNRKSKKKKDKAIGVQAVLQRLSRTALPPIDNDQSLEYMYKQLCINLIKVAGTIEFLLPASLNSFPDHPSWVPDWSADFNPFWLKSTLFKRDPVTATPGSRAYWKLDSRSDNILTVRGRQMCTVAACLATQETFDTYDSSQRDLHRENLRMTLQCQRIFQKQDKTVSVVLEQMNDCDLQPRISARQIQAWKRFMREAQDKDPDKLLSFLETRDSTLTSSFGSHDFIGRRSSSSTILHTQISICNYLARQGRTLFVTNQLHIEYSPLERSLMDFFDGRSNPQTSGWMPRRVGVGSRGVRAGDFVVLIAGVSSPLIIRRDRISTRIVSPAVVQDMMQGQSWDPSWKASDLEEFILS